MKRIRKEGLGEDTVGRVGREYWRKGWGRIRKEGLGMDTIGRVGRGYGRKGWERIQ